MDKPVPEENNKLSAESNFRWVKNSGGIPEIYTNYVHPSWSLFDVRILFGQLKPELAAGSEFVVEEQGAVSFSWGHAKMLASALAGMVEAYESVNGEIPKINLAPRYEDIAKEG